ncbi:MAG: Unknown protein [uncultured Sulfurovum sp.]|uniref:Uncharacterized protein n=1 Tax=uncultured Sulfurovum sp. TaxID=269237 RepID=A0A6S6SKR6_9BACT|nr:MAG: Unknown protein [uncultured Sulfurovum sp.]
MFQKQTKNVQYLKTVITQLNRDINDSIRKKDIETEEIRVKLLALTYSAWSEAQFTQIIYTPNAFTIDEINSMIKIKSIFGKWEKLINLSFEKIETYKYIEKEKNMQKLKDENRNSEIQILCQEFQNHNNLIKEKKDEITYFLKKYIKEPSSIRNKIAHGQWINALDDSEIRAKEPPPNPHLKINFDLTDKLSKLNPLSIMREFEVHTELGQIIRKIIEFKSKGFTSEYDIHMNKIKLRLEETESFTMERKREKLIKVYSSYQKQREN